jgi:RND family efflux transporter MFP subunit
MCISPTRTDTQFRYNQVPRSVARRVVGPNAIQWSFVVRTSSIIVGVVLLGAGAAAAHFLWPRRHSEPTGNVARREGHAATHGTDQHDALRDSDAGATAVEVVKPQTGGSRRTTEQPGDVIPDKSAELYAKVSGYLKRWGVDLDGKSIDYGSRVKMNQVLAVIDMPELEKEVQRDKASLKRAKANVTQMEARVTTANANFRAAEKMLSFRTKVYKRLDALARVEHAMDLRVVDEKEEQMHAAEEAKNAAEAQISQAEADLEEAKAAVDLAQATLELAQVNLEYATIKSPYDGVITERNFWPGDFIRAHEEGGRLPLLSVYKNDVMRVVVKIPDADVPFVHPGDPATVTIDSLPDMKPLQAHVSRIADAADPVTRNMRVEIDLENKDGRLLAGMYGHATIVLDQGESTAMTIPTSCLARRIGDDEAEVYVVRDGKARRIHVRLGRAQGDRVEVLSGLTSSDSVVLRPAHDLDDGAPVEVARAGR